MSAGGFYDTDSEAIPKTFELAEALAAPVVVACVAPAVLDGAVHPACSRASRSAWKTTGTKPLATAGGVDRVLDLHPGLAGCVDTGHAILAGEAPDRFVAVLGGRVGHVHLKDATFPSLRERLIGRRARRRLLPRPEPITPGSRSSRRRSSPAGPRVRRLPGYGHGRARGQCAHRCARVPAPGVGALRRNARHRPRTRFSPQALPLALEHPRRGGGRVLGFCLSASRLPEPRGGLGKAARRRGRGREARGGGSPKGRIRVLAHRRGADAQARVGEPAGEKPTCR